MPTEKRGFRNAEEVAKLYDELHPERQPIFHELHVAYLLLQFVAHRVPRPALPGGRQPR
jgi:hypothetical protein